MGYFEERSLKDAGNPQLTWFCYVDDALIVLRAYFVGECNHRINSIDPQIQFTVEHEEGGQLPFLEIVFILKADGTLKVNVCRKPTHTDQYATGTPTTIWSIRGQL